MGQMASLIKKAKQKVVTGTMMERPCGAAMPLEPVPMEMGTMMERPCGAAMPLEPVGAAMPLEPVGAAMPLELVSMEMGTMMERRGAAMPLEPVPVEIMEEEREWSSNKDAVLDVDSMVHLMEEKLASTRGKPPHRSTIFRVPEDIRSIDAAAYSPKVVSIGLLQHEKRRLDEHKWYYLDKVLRRSKNGLKMYTEEMANIVVKVGFCYSGCPEPGGLLEYWWFKDYAERMLIDGCFIVNLLKDPVEKNDPNDTVDCCFIVNLLKDPVEKNDPIHSDTVEKNDPIYSDTVEKNDPIHSDRWTLVRVALDMLLLENQLPFFVLEKLWELTGLKRSTLKRNALHFFRRLLYEEHVPELSETKDVHHLLHLIHLSLQPTSPTKKPRSTPPSTVPSATELQEAGIKFQRNEKATSFLDVTFEEGLMQLPRLTISDPTNSLFRNLIAFEQGFPDCGSYFTSYCIFMDLLVNTPKDVEILKQSGIIEHVLGSDKEVALLFNKLSRGITWDYEKSYLAKVFEDVNHHTQRRWPKWRAKLVRDYFSNPWAIFSLIAAIVILILTFLQTYFAVFAYFRPP